MHRQIRAGVVALALALAVGACDRIPGTQANLNRQAREGLGDKIIDPDSASFENVRLGDGNGVQILCGEVNAKGKSGSFIGFRRFIVSPSEKQAFIDPQADENSSAEERAYQGGWDAVKAACWAD